MTTATRSEALPDIPTVGDFVPGYEASAWYGVGAPKNTPAEIVDKLNKEINAALADPKIKARLADLGGTVLAGSPADFGKLIADETEKWGKVSGGQHQAGLDRAAAPKQSSCADRTCSAIEKLRSLGRSSSNRFTRHSGGSRQTRQLEAHMPGKTINIRSRDGGEFDCYLVTPETDDPGSRHCACLRRSRRRCGHPRNRRRVRSVRLHRCGARPVLALDSGAAFPRR